MFHIFLCIIDETRFHCLSPAVIQRSKQFKHLGDLIHTQQRVFHELDVFFFISEMLLSFLR